jgi:hypothetical protein
MIWRLIQEWLNVSLFEVSELFGYSRQTTSWFVNTLGGPLEAKFTGQLSLRDSTFTWTEVEFMVIIVRRFDFKRNKKLLLDVLVQEWSTRHQRDLIQMLKKYLMPCFTTGVHFKGTINTQNLEWKNCSITKLEWVPPAPQSLPATLSTCMWHGCQRSIRIFPQVDTRLLLFYRDLVLAAPEVYL